MQRINVSDRANLGNSTDKKEFVRTTVDRIHGPQQFRAFNEKDFFRVVSTVFFCV